MTIVLDLRHYRTVPIFTVREGWRILVASVPPLGAPTSFPPTVVAAGSWQIQRCPRGARCYAFTAVRPGKAEIGAHPPTCLLVSGQRRCFLVAQADARVYVEPSSCDGGAVRISPAPGARRFGPLSIKPVTSRGRADRSSTYTLVRFSDRDPEDTNPVQYNEQVNWGDGLSESAGQIVVTGRRSYELRATHFYCARGVHTVTVTIMKTPAAIYHDRASATVHLRVTVAGRR